MTVSTLSLLTKGVGYVTFNDKDGLLKALSMDQVQAGGRSLRVEVAKPQQNRGGNRRGKSNRNNNLLRITIVVTLSVCTIPVWTTFRR